MGRKMRSGALWSGQSSYPRSGRPTAQPPRRGHGKHRPRGTPNWIHKLTCHLFFGRGNDTPTGGCTGVGCGGIARARGMQRRLAAILFADIAGYTRMMDESEADTHRRMMAMWDEVVEPEIAAAGGCIVKNTGDGFLACFESVGNAVSCAVTIQRNAATREGGQRSGEPLALRMGLHVGDVIIEANDVYGGAVNLAARLQELAEPGTIAISASVREQLGCNFKSPLLDLGAARLRNIATPVHAFRILATSTPDCSPAPAPTIPSNGRSSLAVLSFVYGENVCDSALEHEGTMDLVQLLTALSQTFSTFPIFAGNYKGSRRPVSEPAIHFDGRSVFLQHAAPNQPDS
jgi:class 3 adenylate cyclase